MKELIESLENATGQDRELDGLIYRSLDPVFEQCWPHWTPLQRGAMVPQYTSSIDAALTLVPEHYCWQIKRGIGCEAIVWSITIDYDDDGAPSGHTTTFPAMALCIAALRAREALARSPAETNEAKGEA